MRCSNKQSWEFEMKNTKKIQNNGGKKGKNPKAGGGKVSRNTKKNTSTSVVFTPARNRNSDWNTVK